MEYAGRNIEDEDLREQMKDMGLGTPATRAAIIERLLQVDYITRKGKSLIPTEKGMKLIAIVPEELKSPITTGKWEKGLSSIAKGGMDSDKFMGSITRYVHFLMQQAQTADKSVSFPVDPKRAAAAKPKNAQSLGLCPVCGTGAVFENTKSYYCGRWREGCKFNLWKDNAAKSGLTLTDELVRQLLAAKRLTGVALATQQNERCTADVALAPAPDVRLIIENKQVTEGAEPHANQSAGQPAGD